MADNAGVSQRAVARYQRYQEAYRALITANVWTRPFVFLAHYDRTIAGAMHFEPGIPFTWEGGIYGLVGLLLAMLLLALLRRIVRAIGPGRDPIVEHERRFQR